MNTTVESLVITEKAEPGEVLLTPAELAAHWKISPHSLANMRSQGRGPRFRRFPNGRIRYPEWAVRNYEVGL